MTTIVPREKESADFLIPVIVQWNNASRLALRRCRPSWYMFCGNKSPMLGRLPSFDYYRPTTLDETLTAMDRLMGILRPGRRDRLLVAMKERRGTHPALDIAVPNSAALALITAQSVWHNRYHPRHRRIAFGARAFRFFPVIETQPRCRSATAPPSWQFTTASGGRQCAAAAYARRPAARWQSKERWVP
jgi:hypothetical protein